EVYNEHCERMQEREHRPQSCADSTRRCDSQAGWNFRKAQVDSLKVLDPRRPIREADIERHDWHVRLVPIASGSNRSKKNYSITSSAATSSPGGTGRPSARSETGRRISC